MRKTLILLPLLLAASPALAQPAPQLPPELTDPATADKLAGAMQALSQAFLNVRIGEVEGRPATGAERNMTVRDMARRDDPDFDRHMQQRMANVAPVMRQSMNALNTALPEMMRSLHEAQKSLERAVANMPDPTYPRR